MACSTCWTSRATSASTSRDARRAGPANTLVPQDLLIAFSDGADDDGNGFADDIAGWDFLDNDNDPFDDVQYGHGTGEARDSTAEASNGGDAGSCPNCVVVPLRVGDSFVADVNRFAQATLYAVDNGGARHPGGAGHAELLQARARRRRLRLRARRDGDGLGGGRGGAAPQLAVVAAPRDRRELGTQPRRGHARAEVLSALQRVHELLVQDLARHPEHELLLRTPSASPPGMAGLVYSAALNAHEASRPAGRQRLLPPDRRERVRDHRPTRSAS